MPNSDRAAAWARFCAEPKAARRITAEPKVARRSGPPRTLRLRFDTKIDRSASVRREQIRPETGKLRFGTRHRASMLRFGALRLRLIRTRRPQDGDPMPSRKVVVRTTVSDDDARPERHRASSNDAA
ncbi:hypothetical protein GCM10027063_19350 [Promicromonospora xylanilytica]